MNGSFEQYPDNHHKGVLQYLRGGTGVLAREDWSTNVEVLATKQV